MNDNGKGQEESTLRVKHCPLVNEYCIKERCALYVEMRRRAAGLQQQFGTCAFNAMVQMLSEMNTALQSPQQRVQIPKFIRG